MSARPRKRIGLSLSLISPGITVGFPVFIYLIPYTYGEKEEVVNGSTNVSADAEDEDVAELMEFFKNSNGMNEKFRNLSERVDELKNEEGEVLAMCKLVEEYVNEQKKTQTIEFALNLISLGVLNDEQIATATGLSMDEIKELHPEKL